MPDLLIRHFIYAVKMATVLLRWRCPSAACCRYICANPSSRKLKYPLYRIDRRIASVILLIPKAHQPWSSSSGIRGGIFPGKQEVGTIRRRMNLMERTSKTILIRC